MTTTVADLILDTQALLTGSQRQKLNKLSADPTTGTTFTFTYTPKFRGGSYLSVDDEIVYVWEVDAPSSTATVERAQFGTTSVAHDSGSIVEVNPLYPKVRIRRALQDDVRSWPTNVYQVESLDLTVGASARAVDVTGIDDSNFFTILQVLRSPVVGGDSWTETGYRVERNLNTGEFASGVALILDHAPGGSGATLRVTYAKRFDVSTFTDATTLATIGLEETMYDIAPYGAAWRLISGREGNRTRTDAQGEARAAAEVPPGHILRTAEEYRRLRDVRLEQEAERLTGRWPWNRWL